MNDGRFNLTLSLILEGETPRLLYEWQGVSSIWDAARYTVDGRAEKGQFILAGSSIPKCKGFHGEACRHAQRHRKERRRCSVGSLRHLRIVKCGMCPSRRCFCRADYSSEKLKPVEI